MYLNFSDLTVTQNALYFSFGLEKDDWTIALVELDQSADSQY